MSMTEDLMKANLPRGTRIEFHLTKNQLKELLDASKPVTYMVIGGIEPRSPRENAEAAWQRLGQELHFHWETVLPVQGKNEEYFTAEIM